jgi:hypothetical protein
MVAGNGGRPQPLRRSLLCSGSPLRGLESNKGVSEAMEVLFGGGHPEKHNRVFELRPLTITQSCHFLGTKCPTQGSYRPRKHRSTLTWLRAFPWERTKVIGSGLNAPSTRCPLAPVCSFNEEWWRGMGVVLNHCGGRCYVAAAPSVD